MVIEPWDPRTRSYLDTRTGVPTRDAEAHLEQCLDAIATQDQQLHAFVTVDPEGARAAAAASAARWRDGRPLSPIDGIPVGIKDIIDVAGWPTRMHSALRADAPPARFDAACVAALRRAGAVVIGKTATTEFACGRSTDTVNPFAPARTPGGSSSGAGAAVGRGLIPASLATQTRASTIRPAAFCGAYGFKPTFGALNLGGVHPVAASFDHLGLIGASLEECWSVARVIAAHVGGGPGERPLAGPLTAPPAIPPARLAMVETQGLSESDVATRALFTAVAERLRTLGFEVIDRRTDVRVEALEQAIDGCDLLARELIGFEMRWPYWVYRDQDATALGDPIHRYLALADHFTAEDAALRMARRAAFTDAFSALDADVDLFVTLAAGPAPGGLAETGTRLFITPWTMAGLPSLSLPLFVLDGMPVGLQLAGWRHADARLIAHGRAIEAAIRTA